LVRLKEPDVWRNIGEQGETEGEQRMLFNICPLLSIVFFFLNFHLITLINTSLL